MEIGFLAHPISLQTVLLTMINRKANSFHRKEGDFMKSILAGNQGIYRGISYLWIPDGDVVHLYINDHGKTILLDTGHYTQKRFEQAYYAMTKCLIDVYLSEKETESML